MSATSFKHTNVEKHKYIVTTTTTTSVVVFNAQNTYLSLVEHYNAIIWGQGLTVNSPIIITKISAFLFNIGSKVVQCKRVSVYTATCYQRLSGLSKQSGTVEVCELIVFT